MKNIITILLCALAIGFVLPQQAQAAKKDKKEKKPYVWEMPKLTENKEFDEYLLKCDTMNTRIRQYCENITFYEVAAIETTDDKGEQEVFYQVVDSANQVRSANKAFLQNMDLVLSGASILADMTLMATYTASATSALPSLGMKALSYGKYLKAGPKMIDYGMKEIKEITTKARSQAKDIKKLKKGVTDDFKARYAEVKTGNVEAGNVGIRVIQMSKSDYQAQYAKATKEDKENPVNMDDEKYEEDPE
jgi:hypothetical protein